MDILEKIREEIARHEREIERLNITLDVLELLDKKGALKPSRPAPMFTVKRVGGKTSAVKTKATNVPMGEQVMALIHANGPMAPKQMRPNINFGGRQPNSLFSALTELVKHGKLIRDGKLYLLAPRKEAPPAPQEEAAAEPSSEGGHAAAA